MNEKVTVCDRCGKKKPKYFVINGHVVAQRRGALYGPNGEIYPDKSECVCSLKEKE